MNKPSYYGVLEVSRNASAKDIKSAFRRKVKKLHPDLNKNSRSNNSDMALLYEAYHELSDPIKRASYDASLKTSQQTYNQTKANRSYTPPASDSNPPKSSPGAKAKKSRSGYAYLVIFGILMLIGILQPSKPTVVSSNKKTITTPIETPTPSSNIYRNYLYAQPTYSQYDSTPTSVPEIDCTGPDGKHFSTTQQKCDEFNNAWKPTPTPTPQQNFNYGYTAYPTQSCASCGSNSSCSYGSCVCNSGYVKNYTNGNCEACPQNSTGSYGTCYCNNGYQKNYNTGNCEACPQNSTGSYGTCYCNNGYTKNYQTGNCDVLNCPAHSSVSYNSCVCDSGYSMNYSSNTCQPNQ